MSRRALPDGRGRRRWPSGRPHASPEAAGIFRILQPNADPVPNEDAAAADSASPVPLPPRRPPLATVVSARETLTLAAAKPLSRRLVHPVQKLRDNDLELVLRAPCPPCYDLRACAHDPENWVPVFGKDRARQDAG